MNITQTLISGPTTSGSGGQKSDRSAGAFGAKLDDAITSSSAAPENPDNQGSRPGGTRPDSAGERRNDAENESAEPSTGGMPDVTYAAALPAGAVSAELVPAVLQQAPAGGLSSTVPTGVPGAAAIAASGTGAVADVDSADESGSRLPASSTGAGAPGQHAIRTDALAAEGEAALRSSGTAQSLSTATAAGAGTAHSPSAATGTAAPGANGTAVPEASGANQTVPPAVGEETTAVSADAAGPSAGRHSTADAGLQAAARQSTEGPSTGTNGVPPLDAPRPAQVPQPTHVTPSSAPAAAAPAPPPLNTQLAAPIFSLTAAGRGEHTMTLSVTPDDFGPVTVRAHIGADGVRIELFAGNDAGRDALRSILQELKRDLAGSGLNASLDLSQHDRPGERDGKRAEYGHGSANQTPLTGRQLTSAAYNIRQAVSASTDAGLDVMA